jgi:hypothetical protein
LQGTRQFLPKQREFALDPGGAADHHMIRSGKAMHGNDFAGERAETSFHSVTGDRISDSAADGETDSLQRILVLSIADEEHESGSRGTPAGVRRKEIRAFSDGF